jgi:hypothetical protein
VNPNDPQAIDKAGQQAERGYAEIAAVRPDLFRMEAFWRTMYLDDADHAYVATAPGSLMGLIRTASKTRE